MKIAGFVNTLVTTFFFFFMEESVLTEKKNMGSDR